MGIKDEFHQKAILSCVSELLKQPDDNMTATEQYNSYATDQFAHNLTQHSFNTLERCEKCNKYLRGLLHQGFICKGMMVFTSAVFMYACCNCFFLLDCGLVSHRTCAATGLPSCLANIDRPLGFEFKSIFGQGLCVQFNPAETPAPAIVRSGLTLFIDPFCYT